jgi:hypothetical protein
MGILLLCSYAKAAIARNVPGCKGQPALKADNITAIC